jgi:hypothetical protein
MPDADKLLDDFFAAEAPPQEPPILLPAMLARTALTRQRPAWRVPSWWLPRHLAWRPRTSGGSNTMISAIRFAALGAILALTSGLLFATVTLSPSPASPGPSPTPSPIVMPEGDLEAGATYAIDAGDHGRLVLTVPGTGWFTLQPWHMGKDVMESSDSVAGYDIRLLGPYFVSNINADPCRWANSALEPPVGPTVDDLATALMAQPEQHASSVSDVTLGGYAGKRVELSVPDELGACDGGNYQRWYDNDDPNSYGPFTWGSSQRDTVYIIDVEGTRWVIDTHYRIGVPESDLAELEQLAASIRFETPASPGASASPSS